MSRAVTIVMDDGTLRAVEIPDDAVRDYLVARFGSFSDKWTGRIESAQITLAAAYPSIRCRVLEQVVEDVAARMERVAGCVGPRELFRQHARESLGLPSEGEGTSDA